MSLLRRTLVSGTAASLATSLVLALLARKEQRAAVQPVNSTSHWYHGGDAGRVRSFDLSHTVLGYLTHHLASSFWAVLFEALRSVRRTQSPLADAAGVSALAAFVDYRLVPKRLTPGWELVVSRKAIATAYIAMAAVFLATEMARQQRSN